MFVYVWWMKLWECFHASLVDAVSQSHVEEWICGSFIQSHWPCITLWPISMFSRILARESPAVPSTQAGLKRENTSTARERTSSRRCISIIDRMYLASRSPSSEKTWSWMASNAFPSSSTCSSDSFARGLSIIVSGTRAPSQLDLDRTLGRVDARAHHLALGGGHLAGAQVADPAGRQAPDARVADAHPAAERELEPGLLARDQDGRAAVARRLRAAAGERDRAALPGAAVAPDHRLEALHVQPVR